LDLEGNVFLDPTTIAEIDLADPGEEGKGGGGRRRKTGRRGEGQRGCMVDGFRLG